MQEPTAPGYIEVITGCMFAGKTEELLRRLRRAEIAEMEIGVFTPEIDDRYGVKKIGSHNGESWEATVVETSAEGIDEFLEEAHDLDVVAVDEANFFPGEIVDAVQKLADNGQRVLISGLDQTFRGDPFDPVHKLMAVADEVEKLTAVCTQCGQQATRTQRLVDGEPATADTPTVQVGGDESYEARCRQCHEVR